MPLYNAGVHLFYTTVFKFGNTLVNLRKTTAARELIEPANVARRELGSRVGFTIDNEPVSLGYLIEDYVVHLRHHLQELG